MPVEKSDDCPQPSDCRGPSHCQGSSAYRGSSDGQTVTEAIAAGVGNRSQVLRTGAGAILRVLPDFANQNSATVSGLDMQAAYSFDNSMGAWKVGLAAAWAQEYKVAGQKDAVGQYNVKNPVTPRRALPEWKINGTLNWSNNNHRAFAVVRYIDGYEATLSDEPASGFWNNTIKIFLDDATAAKYYNPNIDSWVAVDAQYTYTLPEVSFLSSSSVTIGSPACSSVEQVPFPDVHTRQPSATAASLQQEFPLHEPDRHSLSY